MPKHTSFAAKSIYYGLALVGICSSLFHGLLKYHAQMGQFALVSIFEILVV